MDHSLTVNDLQSLQNLAGYVLQQSLFSDFFLLFVYSIFQVVGIVASLHERNDALFIFSVLMQLDDVRVIKLVLDGVLPSGLTEEVIAH